VVTVAVPGGSVVSGEHAATAGGDAEADGMTAG